MAQETQRESGEQTLLRAIFTTEAEGKSVRLTIVDAGGKVIALPGVIKELLNTLEVQTIQIKPSIPGSLLKKVVVLRFGFEGSKRHTPSEVGKATGKTAKEVNELTSVALRMLRHPSRSKRLRPFLKQGDV